MPGPISIRTIVSAVLANATPTLTDHPRVDSAPPQFASTSHSLVGTTALTFSYQPPAEPTEPVDRTTPPAAFGDTGSQRWMISVGGGTSFKSEQFAQLGVGVSYFVAHDFSLDLELNSFYFHQPGDDAGGANLNALVRWHFLHNDDRTWSFYADGGAGLLLSSDDVPAHGSEFNFTPQLGAGMSFEIGENRRLFTGIRWLHVSNANIYEENPGRDSLLIYTALSVPF